jgi:hypothetical protein
MSDSETGIENWRKILDEVSTRRYARVTRTVRWVGIEIRRFPIFTEEENLENLIKEFES